MDREEELIIDTDKMVDFISERLKERGNFIIEELIYEILDLELDYLRYKDIVKN